MKLRNIAACAAAVVMAGMLSSCDLLSLIVLGGALEGVNSISTRKGNAMLKYLVPIPFSARSEIVVAVSDEIILPENAEKLVNAAIERQHQEVKRNSNDKSYVNASFSAAQWKAYCKSSFDTALSRITLWKNSGLRLVDRSQIDEAMKEHQFQLSDWTDENKTAQVGKFLNADYVLTCRASPELKAGYRDIWSECTLTFLNVNTLETILLSTADVQHFDYSTGERERRAFLSKLSSGLGEGAAASLTSLPQTIEFVSVKKSAVKYKSKYLDFVCPFIKGAKKSSDKEMKKISSISFNADGKSCTVRMKDGEEENGKLWFKSQSPLDFTATISSKKAKVFSDDYLTENADAFFSGEAYDIHLTDKKIGEISINSPSLELEGAVFRDGDQLVIDYKADKEDGTGHHYFAFFTIEDEDDDGMDDDWD